MTRSKGASLNPRSIWDRWRKPPRYHRRRTADQRDDGDNDGDATTAASAPSISTTTGTGTCTRKPAVQSRGASLQHPPSPIPNESDIQEEATPQMQLQNENVDFNYTLTPPSFVPAPLVVSANRLSKDLRRKHSKRRRGRLSDQTNLSSTTNSGMLEWRGGRKKRAYSEDDEPDDWGVNMALLSPDQRRRHYWQVCYGTSVTPPPQQSWSAQRMPPVKSWCVHAHTHSKA